MIETLSVLRGKDIEIADNITIHQPTLGEIEEYDEFAYMSMVSTFVCTPFDMIAQLDKGGFDFTKVTSFQLFCLLCRQLKQSETKILFGDLDFSSLRAVANERNQIELRNKNVVITEKVYQDISDSLPLLLLCNQQPVQHCSGSGFRRCIRIPGPVLPGRGQRSRDRRWCSTDLSWCRSCFHISVG